MQSLKGPNGGYRLAKSAGDITMLEVLEAVDGPVRGQASFFADGSETPLSRRLDLVCNEAAEQVRKQLAKVKVSALAGRG